jgi:hypothetical protein
MLSMSNAGHHDPFPRSVAPELVRNNDARFAASGSQQLAEEAHGCEAIALGLDQNIEHDAVLINGSPQIMRYAIDLEEDFVEMPLVAGPGTPSPQAISELAAELIAPAPDRFVAHHYATGCHHLLYIAKAHTEPEVQPHAFRDDLLRKSVTTVEIVRHSFSIASHHARST